MHLRMHINYIISQLSMLSVKYVYFYISRYTFSVSAVYRILNKNNWFKMLKRIHLNI